MGKIYIFCPGNVISGGVNSLLMLGKALRKNGFETGMYYVKPTYEVINSPVVLSFGMPSCEKVDDEQGNIIVVPETMTSFISQYKNVKKVVYWLSLHFFFKTPPYRFPFNIRLFRKLISYNWYKYDNSRELIYFKRTLQKWYKAKSGVWDKNLIHLSNSCYISGFLSDYGISDPIVLHNPVRDEFYNSGPLSNRENIILVGPKTSKSIIKQLRKKISEHDIIRARKIDTAALFKLYTKSKLFIELGNANRDRSVREAALTGCVVLVSDTGGSANINDAPIPAYYKLDTSSNYKVTLLEKVKTICSDYSRHYSQQEEYRNFLAKEKVNFESKVNSIFTKLFNGNDKTDYSPDH